MNNPKEESLGGDFDQEQKEKLWNESAFSFTFTIKKWQNVHNYLLFSFMIPSIPLKTLSKEAIKQSLTSERNQYTFMTFLSGEEA